jgi:hypothetical protein
MDPTEAHISWSQRLDRDKYADITGNVSAPAARDRVIDTVDGQRGSARRAVCFLRPASPFSPSPSTRIYSVFATLRRLHPFEGRPQPLFRGLWESSSLVVAGHWAGGRDRFGIALGFSATGRTTQVANPARQRSLYSRSSRTALICTTGHRGSHYVSIERDPHLP